MGTNVVTSKIVFCLSSRSKRQQTVEKKQCKRNKISRHVQSDKNNESLVITKKTNIDEIRKFI